MGEGNTPGNGATSPFGNGNGATQAAGPSSGAHDFLTDPKSSAPSTGGRDFTKESRPQKSGPNVDINHDDMALGGPLPFAQIDAVAASRKDADVDGIAATMPHKPFRLNGGQ